MQSLQKNVLSKSEVEMPYDNIFVWNAYLTEVIRSSCKYNIWTFSLVHGHFRQIRMSIFGRDFSVALVSRRFRHFAGTRYLKRGVNDKGRVANDVETEQIVLDEDTGSWKGKMSSVVQMRGSIPLFCLILVQRYDPTYEASRLHFKGLAERYGNPIIVLNLIKLMISIHSLNAVFLLGDSALNRLPFGWFGLIYFFLWGAIYVSTQWILHARGLSGLIPAVGNKRELLTNRLSLRPTRFNHAACPGYLPS